MALKYYFDTHIAKAVAIQLRTKGLEVVRYEEVEMAEASDEKHLQYATNNSLIMVSQDDDFLLLHGKWQSLNQQHAGIMRVPTDYQGEGQISFLVKTLEFYSNAESENAIDYQTEIFNHVLYL